ncbi:MAG TPA: hypothetical protein VK672_03235 [Solirubrobacteraceae bacterium]|nr:hypothetical protein [Solirubrobacteraceae bacterium]
MFDDAMFAEDLDHSAPGGRIAAQNERDTLIKDGLPPERLKACEAEGRDGTGLPGCAKVYIPEPDGPWGMVFELRIDENETPYMACLAFGPRHPTGPGALSVYEVADRRLNI